MKYAKTDIIKDVRIALEENEASNELLLNTDEDSLTLKELITASILRGIHLVESSAPVEFLEGGTDIKDNDIEWFDGEHDGGGYMILPTDFMRMIQFKMSDWYQPVFDFIDVTSPGYMMQKSKLKGVKGNPEKPVCAIVNHADGLAVEFYSSYADDSSVEVATYLPEPVFDADDNVDVCRRCYQSSVYAIASLVMKSYGKTDIASVFDDLSTKFLS